MQSEDLFGYYISFYFFLLLLSVYLMVRRRMVRAEAIRTGRPLPPATRLLGLAAMAALPMLFALVVWTHVTQAWFTSAPLPGNLHLLDRPSVEDGAEFIALPEADLLVPLPLLQGVPPHVVDLETLEWRLVGPPETLRLELPQLYRHPAFGGNAHRFDYDAYSSRYLSKARKSLNELIRFDFPRCLRTRGFSSFLECSAERRQIEFEAGQYLWSNEVRLYERPLAIMNVNRYNDHRPPPLIARIFNIPDFEPEGFWPRMTAELYLAHPTDRIEPEDDGPDPTQDEGMPATFHLSLSSDTEDSPRLRRLGERIIAAWPLINTDPPPQQPELPEDLQALLRIRRGPESVEDFDALLEVARQTNLETASELTDNVEMYRERWERQRREQRERDAEEASTVKSSKQK